MVGVVGAWDIEPVANPDLREGKRQRLIRMTKTQVAGRSGPLRQIQYRDQVVSPIALEANCRELLRRAQRAIGRGSLAGIGVRVDGERVIEGDDERQLGRRQPAVARGRRPRQPVPDVPGDERPQPGRRIAPRMFIDHTPLIPMTS